MSKTKDPKKLRFFDAGNSIKHCNARISDHALLRYLERFCDVDVEEIRRGIVLALGPVHKKGSLGYTVNGMKFEIRNGVVVTVYAADKG